MQTYVMTDNLTDEIVRRCEASSYRAACKKLNYGREFGSRYSASDSIYTVETLRHWQSRPKYSGCGK